MAKKKPEPAIPMIVPTTNTNPIEEPDSRQLLLPPVFYSQSSPESTNLTVDASEQSRLRAHFRTVGYTKEYLGTEQDRPDNNPLVPVTIQTTIIEEEPIMSTETNEIAASPIATEEAPFDLSAASKEELESRIYTLRTGINKVGSEIKELRERLALHEAADASLVSQIRECRGELRRREDEEDGVVAVVVKSSTPAAASSASTADQAETRKARGTVPTTADIVAFLTANPKRTYEQIADNFGISRSSVSSVVRTMKDTGLVVIEMNGRQTLVSATTPPV